MVAEKPGSKRRAEREIYVSVTQLVSLSRKRDWVHKPWKFINFLSESIDQTIYQTDQSEYCSFTIGHRSRTSPNWSDKPQSIVTLEVTEYKPFSNTVLTPPVLNSIGETLSG